MHLNSTEKQSYQPVPFKNNELKDPTICHLNTKTCSFHFTI